MKHYAQLTDDDLKEAAKSVVLKVVPNVVLTASDSSGIEGKGKKDNAVVSSDNGDICNENEDSGKVKTGQGWIRTTVSLR
ncbi:MAG: hypothetical protein FJ263_09230 [Planctomycetes bacterium]|nr:hypothetical protein [Planctomycetota bacterium]